MKLAMVILGHVKAIDVSDAAWMEWRQVHGRSYSSAAEESLRRSIWERSSFEVERHNARNPHATFAVGRFADFTEDDRRGLTGGEDSTMADIWHKATLVTANLSSSDIVELEASAIDWRGSDLVTPVKDQWPCGSCWAFQSTGLQEAAWSIAGHGLVPLSEQKMVDCNCGALPIWGDGCEMASEADYPYRRGADGGCDQMGCHMDTPVAAKMGSSECVDGPDDQMEAQALQWLQEGPVGIAILADPLYQYDSGILTDCEVTTTNHAVLIVGYGEEGGVPYWLVKNSWGDYWAGEGGYFRMQYGVRCLGFAGGCRMHALDGPTPTPTPPPPPPPPTPTPTPPPSPPSETTCRCDSPGQIAPNNHFTCSDASKNGYCAATEKCVADGDWDHDAGFPCQHAVICSCDSPGQCCVGSNHFTCLDSEFSGYCAEDQMCNIEGNWEHTGDFGSICQTSTLWKPVVHENVIV
jgi:cysteine peptidase B